MRKARSRDENPPLKHGLPRESILRGKREFQQLFESSSAMHSGNLMFVYRVYSDPSKGVKVGFSTPKKTFKRAVDRNKMKRWMRELYRIRQHLIKKSVSEKGYGLHGLFILKKPTTFLELEADMHSLLEKAAAVIRSYENSRADSGAPRSLES
ncbi:MAG TPA: ribonuclease P protein component [Balneolaceae bacterium]|nr:ribonuclease P protein component [Balneolaceae bacterium]